jgi:hypothetical protein
MGNAMKILTSMCVLCLCAVPALVLSQDVLADDCDRAPRTFDLKIKVKNKKATEVIYKGENGDEITVCVNDTIVWKISGPEPEGFFIEFEGDSPLSGDKRKSQTGGKVEAVVTGPVRSDPYKYNIGIDGGEVWDPRIVVGGKTST